MVQDPSFRPVDGTFVVTCFEIFVRFLAEVAEMLVFQGLLVLLLVLLLLLLVVVVVVDADF